MKPVFAIALLALCVRVDAAIVYDSFRPGCLSCFGGGFGANGAGTGGPYELAGSFVPNASGYVVSLTMALSKSVANQTANTNILIYGDAGGLPGDLLETISGVSVLDIHPVNPIEITAAASTLINAGQRYWVSVAPLLENAVVWHDVGYGALEFPDFIGPSANRGGLSSLPPDAWWLSDFKIDYTLRVNATLVPIPAAAFLFPSALAALGWARRKAPGPRPGVAENQS